MTLHFAKSLLAAGAVAVLLAAPATTPANAQDTTWRLSSMMTPDSFEGRAYQRFADLVGEYTNGEMAIRIFPNEQLGGMNSVVEQLSQGVIQLAPSGVSFLSRWEDGIRYAAAPFLFDDYEHWSRFIRSDYFQSWIGSVEQQAGITVLGDIPAFPRGSFRTLLSRQPVTSASDIQGLRVRQYQDQLVIDAWAHLGAEVRVLPWGEVYDGINRGIVDSVTSPAELIPSMRFYEVAPHIIRTDEYPQAVAFMMNKAAFERLPEGHRDALERAHAEAAAYARQLIEESAATLVADLTARPGVTFDTDFDISPLVERMQALYAERDAAGTLPDGLLETIASLRTAN